MIADQIRCLRIARGWSRRQLAEVLGCTQLTVLRWEHGEVRVPYKRLEALSQALHGARLSWTCHECGSDHRIGGREE